MNDPRECRDAIRNTTLLCPCCGGHVVVGLSKRVSDEACDVVNRLIKSREMSLITSEDGEAILREDDIRILPSALEEP